MQLSEYEDILRAGNAVMRNHTWPTLRNQTVGEHTANMLLTLGIVTNDCARGALMRAVRDHDLHEVFTGDSPAPAKWRVPGLREALDKAERLFNTENALMNFDTLSVDEKALLKWLDMYEFARYCFEERMLGNRNADAPFQRALTSITKSGYPVTYQEKCAEMTATLARRYSKLSYGPKYRELHYGG